MQGYLATDKKAESLKHALSMYTRIGGTADINHASRQLLLIAAEIIAGRKYQQVRCQVVVIDA